MAANAAARARDLARVRLFPFESTRYGEVLENARWMDAYAVGNFGQRDRCHHFCAAQAQLAGEGYRIVEVATNIFGYCVRDTINDGLGVFFGGRSRPGSTQAEAVEWARQWHAERPTHREVIARHGYARLMLLEEEVRWFKEQYFGRSSQKSSSEMNSEQKLLFNEAEVLAAIEAADAAHAARTLQISAHERNGQYRRSRAHPRGFAAKRDRARPAAVPANWWAPRGRRRSRPAPAPATAPVPGSGKWSDA